MTYVEVLRECATPNQEETQKFARSLADAHSWYKHLFVHPATPCILHLVPSAPSAKGPTENPGVRRTASWDAGWPTSPMVRHGGDTGLRVAGYQVPVPLKEAGTVLLSALVRPFGFDVGRRSHTIRDGDYLESYLNRVLVVKIEEESVALGKLSIDQMACLPLDLAESIRGLRPLWGDAAFKRARDNAYRPSREYPGPVIRQQEGGGLVPDEVYVEVCRECEQAWNHTEFGLKEQVLIDALFDAFERERARQIGAMVEAMQRFIDSAARLQS